MSSFDDIHKPPSIAMPPPTVDYLAAVDPDVAAVFRGRTFLSFEPLMYQLHKDILKLCETIENKW